MNLVKRNLPVLLDFRDAVFSSLHEIMRTDANVVCLTNDMGAMGLDKIRSEFPARVVNVGIAEQNMMSLAGGMALAGKSVFVYGIVSHVTARCFEQIKLDICVPNLAVTIIGVGAGLAYGVDGPTHHGVEDVAIMRALGNMHVYNPADGVSALAAVNLAYASRRPSYVRMDKEVLPALFEIGHDFTDGVNVLVPGTDAVIVSTGVLSWTARDAALGLTSEGYSVKAIDLFRLKPVDSFFLASLLQGSKVVVTLEESISSGGVGTIVSEALAASGQNPKLRRLSLGDGFLLGSASREWAAERFGLTRPQVESVVREMLSVAKE
jgi:transketolase